MDRHVRLTSDGTHYVFIGSKSEAIKYTDLPYFSLIGLTEEVNAKRVKAKAGGS